MKIKTTKEIIREESILYLHQCDSPTDKIAQNYRNKKWVAVEDLIKYLEKLDSENYIDNMIKELKEGD